MRTRGCRILAGGVVLLCLPAMALAADDGYVLKVHRRARKGDIFTVHLEFEQTQVEGRTPDASALPASVPPEIRAMTRPSTGPASAPAPKLPPATVPQPPAIQRHTFHAELACQVEVLNVNYRGESSLQVTLNKFVTLPEGKEIVAAGKSIALVSDSVDFSMAIRGGGELSDDARNVLRHVHPFEYQLDEEACGSPAAKKTGDNWPVDAKSLATMDSSTAFAVDLASVQGTMSLVGSEKNNTALRLKMDLSRSGKHTFRQLNGLMFDREDLTMQYNTLLPTDANLPPAEVQIKTTSHALGTSRIEDHGKVTQMKLDVQTETTIHQTIELASKPGK